MRLLVVEDEGGIASALRQGLSESGYAVDIAKITALGWTKRRTLDEALAETVAWYRANEWWWRPLKASR